MIRNKTVTVIISLFLCLCLVSCSQRTEVKRTPVDKRFTPAYTYTTTSIDVVVYVMTDIPIIRSELHSVPDTWEILYLITYDDGTERERWETVTKEEYEEVLVQ